MKQHKEQTELKKRSVESQKISKHLFGHRPVSSDARGLNLFELEDRILLSASPAAAAAAPQAEQTAGMLLDVVEVTSAVSTEAPKVQDQATAASVVSRELFFVDPATENYQQLLNDLWSNSDPSRELDVVLLSGNRSGIEQITETLAQYTTEKLDAVHFISHGTSGAIKLGNTWLNQASFEENQTLISAWSHSLQAEADLLFYGCDLARSESGHSLLENIAEVTGADIAASKDASGFAAPAGDDAAFSNHDQQLLDLNGDSVLPSADGSQSTERTLELVILDPGVQNSDQLRDLLLAQQDDGRNLIFETLDSGRNGIEQISEILARYENLDAVHILSHGTADGLQLGNTWLDTQTINNYSESIRGWQTAFASDADLLLYGCDLASNSAGRSLVNTLAQWTGTDVAASEDLTGASWAGGDWDLEYQVGHIETAVAASRDVQRDWTGLMTVTVDAVSTGTSTGGNFSVSHTTSGTDRLMLVGISLNKGVGTAVTSVTYNGISLTLAGTQSNGDAVVEIWYLVNPSVGTSNVVITLNGTTDGNTAGVMTFTGVDQTTPLGEFGSGSQSSGGSGSATITSAANELVFAAIAVDDPSDYDLLPGTGQTEQWDLLGGGAISGGGSTKAGAASVVMDWTWSGSDNWAIGGVSIKPVVEVIASFQEGTAGYTGTLDTFVDEFEPTVNKGSQTTVAVDLFDGGTDATTQGLIRFDNLFGAGAGQIPLGSTINSASLTVNVSNASSVGAQITLHRMLSGWNEASTWNTLSGGVQTDNVEASSAADSTLAAPASMGFQTFTGLAATLQAWSSGGTNNGWVVVSDSIDGWDFNSSESVTVSQRPQLIVNYTPPAAPVITLPGAALNYTESDPATIIDATATASDADSANFDTGNLTVDFTANGTANDRLAIRHQGTGAGQIGVSGSNVTYAGTVIGTFSGGTNGATPLVITFNANSTPAAAQELMRNITFQNVSSSPSTLTRTVRFELTDGDGSTSNAATKTINVSAIPGTTLDYASFLGGLGGESVSDIAVHSSGDIFVVGRTQSADMPTTVGALNTTYSGASDLYVARLSPNGSGSADLVYLTYLGGTGDEYGANIEVDEAGNAYVAGSTSSADFVTTAGAYDRTLGGTQDSFVVKINPTGTSLLFSTYFGGDGGSESTTDLVLDSTGRVYISGQTHSADLPLVNPVDSIKDGSDSYIAQLSADGSTLEYSTFIGGSANDGGGNIAVDSSGLIYFANYTISSDFQTTAGAYQTSLNGTQDAVLAVIDPSLGAAGLLYSTYFGGSGAEGFSKVIVDATGKVYLLASTNSADLPTTVGAYDTSFNGADDLAIVKFNPVGGGASDLMYSTYLGGVGDEDAGSIALDSLGRLYFVGTAEDGFPLVAPVQSTHAGGADDVIMGRFSLDGAGSSDLQFATWLGGSGVDSGTSIALDSAGNVYVVGRTDSTDFPTTAGAYDTTANGSTDNFVAKFGSATLSNQAPVISLPGSALNYTENDAPTIIDATATASDSDSTDFDTGTLTIDFTANGTAQDRLAIRNQGTGAGQIGVSGSNVTFAGVTIGTFAGGTDGSTPLVITFNASSTPAATQALMRNITFENVSTSPATAARTVRFVLSDGDGGTSLAVTKTINVTDLSSFGKAIWRDAGSSSPEVNSWDGSSFGTSSFSASVGNWKIIAGADSPTRDEVIVIGVDNSNIITGQMWNGTTWTSLPINPLGTSTDSFYYGFSVAYEQQSGDAIVVWNDAPNLKYSVWNGISWSAPAVVTAYSGGEPEQIRIAANPNSDELVVAISDINADDHALVWNGSTWGNMQSFNTTSASHLDIHVAYEQQSGDALVVYGRTGTSNASYRVWNGITWSSEGTIIAPAGTAGNVDWTAIAVDSKSDRIAIGVLSDADSTWFSVWDGNTWNSADTVLATTSASANTFPALGIAFEGISGNAIATYGEVGNAVRYRTWDNVGGWSTQQIGPDLFAQPNSMTLDGDPLSNNVMLSVQDDDNDLSFVIWDGSSWGPRSEQEINTTQVKNQPFLFLWDIGAVQSAAPTISLPGGVVDYTENDAAIVIDAGATASDPDSADFDSGSLTVGFTVNGMSHDRLAIRNQGTGAGQIGVSGSNVTFAGVTIGTFAGGTDGSTPLVITFNASSTPAATQALMRNITYQNTSDAPSTLARTVRFILTDGDGGISNAATKTINVAAVNDAPVLDNTGTMTLPTITKSQTNSGGQSVRGILASAGGDRITDVDNFAVEGIAITTLASGNGTWQYTTDNGINWMNVGAVSNSSALLLRDTDLVRFVPNGVSPTTASFDFRAWDQSTGTCGTKVDVSVNGGTNAFSTAIETVNITVIDINTAPVLDSSKSPVLTAINEDAGAPSGAVGSLVSQLVDFATPSGQVDNVTDGDAGAGLGIAITAADTTNGTWFYSIDNGVIWNALDAVSDGNARLLAADGITRIYFQPNANYHGSLPAAITFRAWDQTSGTNGGTANTSSSSNTYLDTFSSVSYSNSNGPTNWTTNWVESDSGGSGAGGGNISVTGNALRVSPNDRDDSIYREIDLTGATSATLSFAYNATLDSGNPDIQVRVSGNGGSSYVSLVSFTSSSSGTLSYDISPHISNNTRIQFYVVGNAGGPTSNVSFDDVQILSTASNTGGSTAFSTSSDTASIVVNPVADTPSITNATTNEDTQSTSGLVISRNAGDGAEVTHYKVTGISNGTLYKNDGVTQITNGSFITFAEGTAGLKFTPTPDFNGTGNFTIQASTSNGDDGLGGSTVIATITVNAVNDAPVLDNTGTMTLPMISKLQTNNGGADVATIIASAGGDRITDVDTSDSEGIAITTLASGNGTWEYSINGGASWTAIGTVSNTSALLLGSNDLVRFVPNGVSGTTASFDFYAWDQTSGTAGTKVDASTQGTTTAFSTASETANITVNDVNAAPVLDNSKTPVLTATNEDAGAPSGAVGSLISSLVDFASPSGQVDNVTDVDSGAALGVAITAADTTNGNWFYSIDNGTTWNALGAVSDASARLLAADANTRLYFQANANYFGTLANAITFRAWDQTSGVNGGTASVSSTETVLDQFSAASYSNNNGTRAWSTNWVETDSSGGGASGGRIWVSGGKLQFQVASANNNLYREVDLSSASNATLSFSYQSGLGASATIRVEASGNGGASYTTLPGGTFNASTNTGNGTLNFDLSAYLSANTRIRFFVVSGETGAGNNQFNVDDFQIQHTALGGGSTAFSTATDTISQTVNPVADTPTVTNTTTNEDTQSTSGLVISRNVADGAEVTHFKITGITNGTLYKNDGVTQITNGSFITIAEGTAGLKFTPTPDFNGTGSFTIQASTSNGDGGLGGSTADATITVNAVNDVPMLINNTLNINEGGVVLLTATELSATDTDHTDSDLIFTVSNVTGGHFERVSFGQSPITSFTQAQINAGEILFVHDGGELAPTYNVSVSDGSLSTTPAGAATNFTNVNDPPVISGLGGDIIRIFNNGIATRIDVNAPAELQDRELPANYEGATLLLTSGGFVAGDLMDLDTSGTLSLSAGYALGSEISISGLQIATITNLTQPNGTITFNANANLAHVSQVLQSFLFSTTSTTLGKRTVDFTFNDNDGTANGGAEVSSTETVAILVAKEGDGLVITDEDMTYTFLASDFNFTGLTGSNQQSIKIISLPAQGTLTVNGAAASIGQVITKADIQAGLLCFVPDANENGVGYGTFDFVVNNGVLNVSVLAGEATSFTLNGGSLKPTDMILANPDNFGASGTYSSSIAIVAATTTIDAAYLSQGNVLFNGYVPDSNWTVDELNALDTWVQGGGVLISNSDSANYDAVSSYYGLVIGGSASNSWLIADETTSIINGPFGSVGNIGDTFNATGAIGYFNESSLEVGDLVIARDWLSRQPTVVLRQHGSGWILFTGDEGIFRANMNTDGKVKTSNEILAANIFAWAADAHLNTASSHTMNIDVVPVNDDPQNLGTLPVNATVTEDVATAIDLSGIDLSDIDSASGNLTLTLNTVNSGTLSAIGDAGITVSGTGTTTITLTGTQNALNAFLDNSTSISYTGANNANGNGADKIQLRVTDNGNVGKNGGGQISLGEFDINITAVNDAPTVSSISNQTIDEDTTLGPLGFTVDDIETSPDSLLVYATSNDHSIIPDGNIVMAGSGVNRSITLTPELNANGGPVTITIFVSDGTSTTQTTFTVTVNPVNDAPVITSGNFIVSEGLLTVGSVESTDTDGGIPRYTLIGGADQAHFSIDPLSGEIYFSTLTDFEDPVDADRNNVYELQVQVDDGATGITVQNVTVTVTDTNDTPPVIAPNQQFSIAENSANSTAVGTVLASDEDTIGTRHNWQIIGGNTDNIFAINPLTGVITVADNTLLNFEYETNYNLEIVVSDGVSMSAPGNVLVNVTNVNEQPHALTLTGGTVDENSPTGTAVALLATADVDAGETFEYTLLDDANGRFQIGLTSGVISVLDGSQLNFEASTSQQIRVQVQDRGGLTYFEDFTIELNDINEAPVISASNFSLNEHTPVGTIVSTVGASDPDALNNLTFRIVSGNTGGIFTIDPATGDIRVLDRTALVYEQTPTISLTIEVSDQDLLTDSATIEVTVLNINDAPVASQDQNYQVQQFDVLTINNPGLLAGAYDNDGDNLTPVIVTGPSHGILTVQSDGSFEYDSVNTYYGTETITYVLSDGLEQSSLITLTIDVKPLVPPPVNPDPAPNTTPTPDPENVTPDSDSEQTKTKLLIGPVRTTNGTAGNPKPPAVVSLPESTPESTETPNVISEILNTTITTVAKTFGIPVPDARTRGGRNVDIETRDSKPESDDRDDFAMTFLAQSSLWEGLDDLKKDLGDVASGHQHLETVVVGTTAAVTGSLTVGYVVWLIRGGSLVATMVSVMPTWGTFDPLPVLDRFQEVANEEDQEDLVSLVVGNSKPPSPAGMGE